MLVTILSLKHGKNCRKKRCWKANKPRTFQVGIARKVQNTHGGPLFFNLKNWGFALIKFLVKKLSHPLVDVAGKTSMNLNISKLILQEFPWFRQKLACLYFVWRRQILYHSCMQTLKISFNFVWNLQNLAAAPAILFCKNYGKIFKQVSQNLFDQFFLIMIIYSFHASFYCDSWKIPMEHMKIGQFTLLIIGNFFQFSSDCMETT